jgi:hypothetical protein
MLKIKLLPAYDYLKNKGPPQAQALPLRKVALEGLKS